MKGKKMVSAVCTFLCAAVFLLYWNNDIGIPASGMVQDIHSSQKIQEDWQTKGENGEHMAAFLSFPEDEADHTFSVYVNRKGLSFGWFFRGGGSLTGVGRYITEFTVEGCTERAFISMNGQNIVCMETDDGSGAVRRNIEQGRPFAFIVPAEAGTVTFYDAEGQTAEVLENKL